jgi:hypothetical protein
MKLTRDSGMGEVFFSLSPEIQAAITSALFSVWEDPTRNLERSLYLALDETGKDDTSLEELRDTHNSTKFLLTKKGKVAVARTESETPQWCLSAVLSDPTNIACPWSNGILSLSPTLSALCQKEASGNEKALRPLVRDSIKVIKGAEGVSVPFKLFPCNPEHQRLFSRLEAHSPFMAEDSLTSQALIRAEETSLLNWEKEKHTREEWNTYRSYLWTLEESKRQLASSGGRRLDLSWKLQPAGRLQEVGFGAYRLSEKRTNLRKSLLRDANGSDLCAFDCSSSGWLLAALLLGDEATYQVTQNSLNDTATDVALAGGHILHNDEGKGRKAVKKLMMTFLYGSKPHRQYLEASWGNDIEGVWRDIDAPMEFLEAFGSDFPTFTTWMEHCRSLQKEKKWTWPELFSGETLNAFRPETEVIEVFSRKNGVKGVTRKRIMQLPGAGCVPDERRMGTALAPVIIHSLDACLLKFALRYLMDRAEESSVISPVHDCVIVSQDLTEHVQSAWNWALREVIRRMPQLREALGLPIHWGLDSGELNVKLSREY